MSLIPLVPNPHFNVNANVNYYSKQMFYSMHKVFLHTHRKCACSVGSNTSF